MELLVWHRNNQRDGKRIFPSMPLVLSLLMLVSLAYHHYPLPAQAQMSDRESCDAEICHVRITEYGFIPKILIVKIGTAVVWANIDDGGHTVTSGSPGEIAAPLQSSLLEKDDTYEFTFDYAGAYNGTYKYFDQSNEIMRGQIIVEPEPETTEPMTEVHTIKMDITDPRSGVKNVSFADGNITGMKIEPDSRSLIITVRSVQNIGILGITLDRNLIDAKTDGKDSGFTILTKKAGSPFADEGYYEEIALTPTERALRIVVPIESEEIRIIGTHVVPEFPITDMPVLTSIVAVVIALGWFGILQRFNKLIK